MKRFSLVIMANVLMVLIIVGYTHAKSMDEYVIKLAHKENGMCFASNDYNRGVVLAIGEFLPKEGDRFTAINIPSWDRLREGSNIVLRYEWYGSGGKAVTTNATFIEYSIQHGHLLEKRFKEYIEKGD